MGKRFKVKHLRLTSATDTKTRGDLQVHSSSVENWRHGHVFLGAGHARNEWRSWIVVALTAGMMLGEILAGLAFGSMALLADGFHMATHAAALAIAAVAYVYARRRALDHRFTFGTGKLGELAGYSSALILAVVALMIGVESAFRLAAPVPIRFDEAIAVAVLGLIVNLLCAWVLHEDGSHHHDHNSGPARIGGHDHHRDHNMRAAYAHVLADALTSLLAIVALVAGRTYGWLWIDPLTGIVGAVVIARWSWILLKGAGATLLDIVPDEALSQRISKALEQNGDRIADLHLWRVGPGHIAVIVSVVSDRPQRPDHYKAKLSNLPGLSHVTVEVHPCESVQASAH